MASREKFGVEREKSIYTKEWRAESRDNPVILWCAGSKTWRKIENDRISDKKPLVARSN